MGGGGQRDRYRDREAKIDKQTDRGAGGKKKKKKKKRWNIKEGDGWRWGGGARNLFNIPCTVSSPPELLLIKADL